MRPLFVIANEISKDWKNVNYAAAPYLKAMKALNEITDNYGYDSGTSIVDYFLCNAATLRGEVAKVIKAELREMVKSTRKSA